MTGFAGSSDSSSGADQTSARCNRHSTAAESAAAAPDLTVHEQQCCLQLTNIQLLVFLEICKKKNIYVYITKKIIILLSLQSFLLA